MGGCQNYGPFWGTLNIRGRIIIGTQKGTIILTTPPYMGDYMWKFLRTRGSEGPEASGDGLGFRVLWF